MDVLHAVHDDFAHLLEALVAPHHGNGVALDEDVARRQKLQRFEGLSLVPHKPLPPLHETLAVTHDAADLDDVALAIIVKNAQRLLHRDRAREELDEVARLDDDVRIHCLARCPHRH